MRLTEKERTFLTLKYGENYQVKIIDEWHTSSNRHFTEIENRIMFDWLREMAGIARQENKNS